MKTLIYIVRHGQSIGNLNLQFLGHTDVDLSPLGERQVAATADYLSDVDFSVIASSDLIRAYNTALPHARLRAVGVVTDPRLRELFCGEWEGMYIEDIKKVYKEIYTEDWVHRFGSFVMPGGEAMQDCVDRFEAGLRELAESNPGANILVASHGGSIRGFWGRILGLAPDDVAANVGWATNASYSIVEYDGEKFIPISYSNDEHLAGMTSEWRD